MRRSFIGAALGSSRPLRRLRLLARPIGHRARLTRSVLRVRRRRRPCRRRGSRHRRCGTARRGRLSLLVFTRLFLLALLDSGLSVGRAPFALVVIEQHALLMQTVQRGTALGAHLGQAGRNGESSFAGRFALPRTQLDLRALTLDASALLRCVVLRADDRCHQHERRQQPAVT